MNREKVYFIIVLILQAVSMILLASMSSFFGDDKLFLSLIFTFSTITIEYLVYSKKGK